NWGYPPPKGQPTKPAGPGGAGADAGGEAAHAAVAAAPSAAQRKRAQVQLLLRQAAAQSIPPSPPVSADDFISRVAEKAHNTGAKFGFSPGLENDDVNSWLNPKVKEWMDQRLLNYVVPELYF